MIMSFHPVGFLRALFGAVFLGGFILSAGAQGTAPAPSPSSQPVRPMTAPRSEAEAQAMRAAYTAEQLKWEDGLNFELVGIGRVAGVPVALLAVERSLCAVKPAMTLAGREVDEIDVENQRVTLRRRDQSSTVLILTPTNPIKIPDMHERQMEFLLTKEGIRRMNSFHGMPMELHMVWDKVSREGQVQVLMRYLQQGMVVGALKSEGYAGKLLEKQISERLAEKRNAFTASLTPEQKTLYTTRQPAIRFTAPLAERDKLTAAARETQQRQAEMLANLTPEQRALYDEYQSWIRPREQPAL